MTIQAQYKSKYGMEFSDKRFLSNDTEQTPDVLPFLESDLWAKIKEAKISDNQKALKEYCQLYQMNCELKIFENCKYEEEVLFYLIVIATNVQRRSLIKGYKNLYPEGKYHAYLGAATEPNAERANFSKQWNRYWIFTFVILIILSLWVIIALSQKHMP